MCPEVTAGGLTADLNVPCVTVCVYGGRCRVASQHVTSISGPGRAVWPASESPSQSLSELTSPRCLLMSRGPVTPVPYGNIIQQRPASTPVRCFRGLPLSAVVEGQFDPPRAGSATQPGAGW